ncbi:MAG: ATP-binding cassette domain-containing protein, partial [Chloroflexi bacterium]|nr:ATP-binding cassette domain-containing protein [Chloroflexota bacterium]
QAASRLQLEDRMDDRVRRLSHGYRKRVSIARAILHTPSLLLLDEPETGLDDASMLVLSEIIEEWRSNGRAVLIATHSSDFVNGLADIAFTMVSGKLARLNGLMID